jgi:hypothetical protein
MKLIKTKTKCIDWNPLCNCNKAIHNQTCMGCNKAISSYCQK